MKHRQSAQPPGFTLIELLVVIAIIAVLAGLLFPVFGKVQRRAAETRTVSNLRQIAAGISTYCGEHNDTLPGPLTQEQYPVFGTDPARDKGSLAKRLAPYLSIAKKTSDSEQTSGEFDVFECPGAKGPKRDEIPGFIMNMDEIPDLMQPPWGRVGEDDKPPVKRATLTTWRDTSKDAVGTDSTVVLSRKWAMRHTDQLDAEKLSITGEWVAKLPKERVFDDHYQALYYDWHVEPFVPDYLKTDEQKRNQ